MDKNEYINKVLAHISNRAFVNTIKTELENHIADREEYYTEIGYDTKTAEQKAMEHMGDADTVGEEMNMLHNYKKHKIISIAGLIMFAFLFMILWFFQSYLSWIFDRITIPLLCISVILTYIIYKYAFASRCRIVLFFQGAIDFFASLYYADNFNFTWIYNTDFVESLSHFVFAVTGTVFFINCIICLTCSAEITALIKGRPNFNIIKRYEKYGNFLFVFAIVCIVVTVGFLFIRR